MSMKEPQLLAGVSLGFNSIHAIIVREETDSRLRLMGEYRYRRVVEKDQTTLINRVRESIEKALEDAHEHLTEILAIGVAAPGQIDVEKGLMLFSPHFHVYERPFPLVAKLHEHVGARHIALVNNDDAHGIGEQRIGEGKEIKDLVHIRVGYNVGAGIIINEQLYTGADNLAGSFGHMVVDSNGPECYCGNHGCLETFVSRESMAKKLMQRYKKGEATVLAKRLEQEPLDINSAMIADAIDQEDALTIQVVEEAAEILGIGIANVINFLNPHRIILGGDVINEVDLFYERAVASAQKRALHASIRNVSIVRGRLGTTGAAYGAAVFAKEQLMRQEA